MCQADDDLVVITSPGAPTRTLPSKGIIAVDMDDVLCQTNATIVKMHNEIWNLQPPLTLADFKHYLYWLNRGWGDGPETMAMVHRLYRANLLGKTTPVPGAKEAIIRLKEMGYGVIIITARSEASREVTEDWLAEHMPDLIDEIHFTGAFAHLEPTKEETEGHAAKRAIISHHKRTKAEVVHSTKSLFLIDDSAENAYDAATQANPPVKVLLFGNYPWNEIVYRPEELSEEDKLTYKEKEAQGLLGEAEEKRKEMIREGWLPQGVERVASWNEVIKWVERMEQGS